MWSIASMLMAWFLMYHSALYILETTLHFKEGASFDTVVKKTLGKWPNFLNGLMLLFLLYVLDYAFISGGGSMVQKLLSDTASIEMSQAISAIFFAFTFSLVIWIGMKMVDRVATVLFIGMITSFLMTTGKLGLGIDMRQLLETSRGPESQPFYYFVLAALPFYLTSFGFYSVVPSLVKYYHQDAKAIKKCMLSGSVLCLLIYFLWLLVTMGNLSREEFIPIIEQGGNVAILIDAILQSVQDDTIYMLLNLFANLGLISSFIGVSLGLFDYIADRFDFDDTPKGRLKSGLVTFLPPTIGGAFFPHGFVQAIGFAGLILAINGLIIPSIVALKARQKFDKADFKVWGGKPLIYFMIISGIALVLIQILGMSNMLTVYPG